VVVGSAITDCPEDDFLDFGGPEVELFCDTGCEFDGDWICPPRESEDKAGDTLPKVGDARSDFFAA